MCFFYLFQQEYLSQPKKVDVFSAGATAFFIFSGGQEPFGERLKADRVDPNFEPLKAIEAKLPADLPMEARAFLKVGKIKN